MSEGTALGGSCYTIRMVQRHVAVPSLSPVSNDADTVFYYLDVTSLSLVHPSDLHVAAETFYKNIVFLENTVVFFKIQS